MLMLLCIIIGEGPPFMMTTDEVEIQAETCNKKKKSAKLVQVSSCSLLYRSYCSVSLH